MVFSSILGVVPVLNLPMEKPSFLRSSEMPVAGNSPHLPAGLLQLEM